MQGNAMARKHEQDAQHLYDAALWQCAYFITCYVRILKRDDAIASVIDDLWIVRPSALLALFHAAVAADQAYGHPID